LSGAPHFVDRAALDIALGRYEVAEAAKVAVEACMAAGATGARVQLGAVVVELGTLGAHSRNWMVQDVDLHVDGTDAADLATALALLLARTRLADDRRKTVHDLRGLLAVVSGQTEMLAMSVWGPVSPAQKKALDTIARQVERITPLLDRLRS
jgi:signal transduction histidine kinase